VKQRFINFKNNFKNMDEKNSKFFKIYYILVIVYAFIGLFDTFLYGGKETFKQVEISGLYSLLIGLFEFAIFVLSIVALVLFIKNKFSKITLVIPIYHIVMAIFVFVYAIIWGIINVMQSTPISEQLIPPGLIAIGIISSLFELFFSGYVLYKFK